MRESTTPLTPEEERLRAFASASPEDIADMVWYESDLIAADVRAVLATFDAARAAAPDGLREAALAAVKATGCIRVFWGARKPCDDPIYSPPRRSPTVPESTTPLTQEEEERLRAVLGFQRPVNPSWEDIDNRCVGQCEHANHGPFFCDVIVGGTFEPEYCECPPDRTMWSLILDYSARLFATLDAARADRRQEDKP